MNYKSYLIEKNISAINENLVLIYGENPGVKDEIKKEIKKTFKEFEILLFNQDEILKNPNLLFTEINNISLFEKGKIILINQSSDKIVKTIEELSEYLDNQKIFLFADILDKKSKLRNFFEKSKACAIVPCYEDNEQTLKRIILDRLNRFKGLNTININMIIKSINFDRSKLYNELDKIITFFQNKEIDTVNLEKLLNIRVNEDFKLLRDAALLGDKLKTNNLLSDTYFDADRNIFYLNSFYQRLDRLKEITKLEKNIPTEQKINELKPPIFWKDKPNFVAQSRKWSENKINKKLKELYSLETSFKSNNVLNKEIALKKFIVDVCVSANSY